MPKPAHHPLLSIKHRGESAELKFMAEAAARGLTVLKPHGDSARYDVVVDNGARLLRVQVKSTSHLANGAYRCCYTTRYRAYSANDFDILAAYVFPYDAWYIIPSSAVPPGRVKVDLYPHRPRGRRLYDSYREAWRLLLPPPERIRTNR